MTTAEITEAIETAIEYMAYSPFSRVKDQEIEDAREALRCILADRAKNPGVWDGAPDNATMCSVKTWANGIMGCVSEKEYKRELPKTLAREIAEARAKTEISIPDTEVQLDVNELADVIESAIIEYEEELK